MIEKICSFCGHRDCDSSLRVQIKAGIIHLIENNGINTFYSGSMGNFDHLCEGVVRELKHTYPIKLYLIAPYMTKQLNANRAYYEEMYDGVIIPDLGNIHYKRAIIERNKWIVDRSDVLLCYVVHSSGGAYQTYRYAQKMNKIIRNLVRFYDIF